MLAKPEKKSQNDGKTRASEDLTILVVSFLVRPLANQTIETRRIFRRKKLREVIAVNWTFMFLNNLMLPQKNDN